MKQLKCILPIACMMMLTALAGCQGHTHHIVKVEKEDATCLEEGHESYYQCDDCKEMFQDEKGEERLEKIVTIPAKGHNFSKEWSSLNGKHFHDCLNGCGEHADEAECDYDYTGTNLDTHTAKCKICEHVEIEEHTWHGNGQNEAEQSCECGETYYVFSAAGGLDSNRDIDEDSMAFGCSWNKETRIGASIIASQAGKAQLFAEISEDVNEVKFTDNYKTYINGASFESEAIIAAYGKRDYFSFHRISLGEIDLKQGANTITFSFTPDKNGSNVAYNFRSFLLIGEGSYSWNVSRHLLQKVDEKDANCVEKGHEAYYQCSICEERFEDEEGKITLASIPEIPALGHHMTTHPIDDPCSSNLTEYYSCDRCLKIFADSEGKTEITNVEDLGHDYHLVDNGDGTHSLICSVCEKVSNTSEHEVVEEQGVWKCECGYHYYLWKEEAEHLAVLGPDRNASSGFKISSNANSSAGSFADGIQKAESYRMDFVAEETGKGTLSLSLPCSKYNVDIAVNSVISSIKINGNEASIDENAVYQCTHWSNAPAVEVTTLDIQKGWNQLEIIPKKDVAANFDYLQIKSEMKCSRANLLEAEDYIDEGYQQAVIKNSSSAHNGKFVDGAAKDASFTFSFESDISEEVTLCVASCFNGTKTFSQMFESIVINGITYTFGSGEGQLEDLIVRTGTWYTGYGNPIMKFPMLEGENTIVIHPLTGANFNLDYILILASTMIRGL